MLENDNTVTLRKVATSDLSGGGILNTQQADKFITFTIDESIMKNNVRIRRMQAPVEEIDRLHLGTRVARGKTECVDPGTRVTVSGSAITLNTVALVVPWEICWEVLEDNIEGAGFETTLMQDISRALANDLEELAIQGDTTSVDSYLALKDGWLKLMTADSAHDVDVSGLADHTLTKTVFSRVLKGLPTKYRRNRSLLRFFVNVDQEQDYRETLTARDTNLGDSALTNADNLRIYGIPIVPVPYMPKGYVVLTNWMNFIFGIWRKIRLEKDKDIMIGKDLFAFHMRVGFAVEKGDAVAYTDDVADPT